jgi:hypothetical protein
MAESDALALNQILSSSQDLISSDGDEERLEHFEQELERNYVRYLEKRIVETKISLSRSKPMTSARLGVQSGLENNKNSKELGSGNILEEEKEGEVALTLLDSSSDAACGDDSNADVVDDVEGLEKTLSSLLNKATTLSPSQSAPVIL